MHLLVARKKSFFKLQEQKNKNVFEWNRFQIRLIKSFD